MFGKLSKWSALVTALVLMSTLLYGCGGGGTTSGAGDSQIVIVIAEDPPSFNATLTDTGYDALVMELVMLGLTDIDPEGNILPELAAELPTIENGGVVVDEEAATMDVTWTLRTDIEWSDGTLVSAQDVVFTYDAITDPEKGGWIQGIDYVDSVEMIDDSTVVFHFNAIYPGYLTLFGGEQMAIWPAHYCDLEQGFSQWDCAYEPLSNGPYILEEWVVGDHLTFVRNPNYYEAGKPSIETIIVRIVPDQSVRKQMLINGDADLDMWTTEGMIADLEGEPNVEVNPSPKGRFVMRIFFNLAAKGTTDPVATPHPILSDLQVRQAIQMAIDVDTLTEEFFYGIAEPVWTEFFRPPYDLCSIDRPTYDLEGAAALLEQAGWIDQDGDGVRECHGCATAEEGYKMEMEFITYAEYGEPLELTQQYIAEKLGDIGIKLDLSIVEGSVLWAASTDGGIEQSGNFDMDIWDDGYYSNDPTDFLWSYYASDAAIPDYGYNYGRWMNSDFDDLLWQTYTLDEEVRQDAFCQMANLLNDELPQLLLFTTVTADAHSTRLQGVQSSTNDLVTWNAADWTLK